MIKDVKSYFNTVTSRLSNAFNIQNFDTEDEAQFWALAAEHLSRKDEPSFRDMVSWMDLLFKAPVHFVYRKEGEKLQLFRHHLISENLEFLNAPEGEKAHQTIKKFEDRLANLESKIPYKESFKVMGVSTFTVGQCHYIPLFKGDDLWGIYVVGPYVKPPEVIVPRISIIGRILTNWLTKRHNKQANLQLKITNRLHHKLGSQTASRLGVERVSHFLMNYLIGSSPAKATLLVKEGEAFSIIQKAKFPDTLLNLIENSSSINKGFTLAHFFAEHEAAFKEHGFETINYVNIGDKAQNIVLYIFTEGNAKASDPKEIHEQVQRVLAQIVQFENENNVFSEQLLDTYYGMLRYLEQKEEKTLFHTPRILAFCSSFADLFGLKPEEKNVLLKTARFHDIGYVGLGETTMAAEMEHPRIGSMMLQGLSIEDDVLAGIETHHEWIDGSGTPAGQKEGGIPWTGKIVANFEFIVEFIESHQHDDSKDDEAWKHQLTEALVERTGKQFDMILMPTVIELISALTWKECCTLGVHNEA